MCGIIGYIGNKKAAPRILDGLKRLEYRGYDSAGIATVTDNELQVKKGQGQIDEIDEKLTLSDMDGNTGIGHTRWATHGAPSQKNAHPHVDEDNAVSVVHNGIIENYGELKKFLTENGYEFHTETDTEVVPHLINYFMSQGQEFEEAVRNTINRLEGSYALAVTYVGEPDKVIVVREQSPLIIGVGEDETLVASDIPAILPHTKRVIILNDGEIGVLTPQKVEVMEIDSGKKIEKELQEIDWSLEMAEKGGYPHFMLKEIFEQPEAIKNTLRVPEGELGELSSMLNDANQIYIVACGTSYHAALVGKYALAKLAGVSSEAVISSEFQESCVPEEGDVVFAITQSGETADTLKAVKIAKENGAKITSLTNVIGSSITRMSDLYCLTRAGPEIGVAATKTFVSQITYLLSLAFYMANDLERISDKEYQEMMKQLMELPEKTDSILDKISSRTKDLGEKFVDIKRSYFIGRGIGFPTALEGSLKLKEIAYVHSGAHPAGELKHGPLALVEPGTLVIALVTPGPARERMIGNIEEVRARGGRVLALAPEGDEEVAEHVEEVISLPQTLEILSPIIYVLPLQLMAYHMSVDRGHDPDKPRHLAKSVTVE
ncbi:MAG: glutamine--fructose-6-phosphate transaminase (isomerizing) [Hadesarchaea archaeon]|nr:glutamine--fructose-6-phosphate transaminase (isomerizing) [Hadesarchaea archaeon]